MRLLVEDEIELYLVPIDLDSIVHEWSHAVETSWCC